MRDSEPTGQRVSVPPRAVAAWRRVGAELAAGREDAAQHAAIEAMSCSAWADYPMAMRVVTTEYRMSDLIPRGWMFYAYVNDGWDELVLVHPDAMLFLVDAKDDQPMRSAALAAGCGLLRFDVMFAATLG